MDRDQATSHDWRLLVGGELRAATGGATFTTVDPSTEEALATVPDAKPEDVSAAVAAGRQAFGAWGDMAARERGAVVRELAGALRANAEELAALDAIDGGFPIANMRNDVGWAAELLELFADWAIELKGQTIPASAGNLHYTVRRPWGVVGRIIPFNHPILFAAGKIAAPLVAGNAVVLKPADQTPLSALRMGEIFAPLLPPGILSVLASAGPEAPRALVAHPDVRRLAFIGSDRVGRQIQADAAASGVKQVTLELGGKNAMLVFPDADLDAAARGAVAGMNFAGSQGQSCGSNSRVLAHRSIVSELSERVAAVVGDIRLGPPLDDATQMGPLVSAAQRERTEHYVKGARDAGARLLAGGSRPAGMERGYWHLPTVFDGVSPDMAVANEEVFGPLLSILPFEDRAEAVAISNSVRFGLTGSVWTRDLELAHRTVQELDTGYVWVNSSSRHFWGMPFGGTKDSGVGDEEDLGELLSFTQTKAVNLVLA